MRRARKRSSTPGPGPIARARDGSRAIRTGRAGWRASTTQTTNAPRLPPTRATSASGPIPRSSARSDRAHRELQWTVAIGPSPHVAEAAARLAPDASFDRHLREAGILSANVGFYTWPRGEARARAGLALVHLLVAVLDIPAGPARSAVWRGGVRELEGASRLVESPPRLLSSLRVVDRTATWTLTPEGRTFFASLKLPPGADVMRLRKAIAATLRPQGVFRSPAELDRTFEMYGGGLRDLLRHFVWPHRIAMGALHPRERSLVPGDFTGDRSTDVTLDLERGELRLREQDTAKRE